jgi:glutathione synthase/RimK-type ligase-like ATP-grasp enzyme
VPKLVVVNTPRNWPFHLPDVEVVEARAYLTEPEFGSRRGVKVYNLCKSYRYQSTGYYVTLLAAARGHRPSPGVATIQDTRAPFMARIVSENLEPMIQKSLSHIQGDEFTLSIYFGRNIAKRYDQLARELYHLFEAPLLRARFVRNDKWYLKSIAPVSMGDVPDSHREFVFEVASEYFRGRRPKRSPKRPTRYDMAILVDPAEEFPPSDAPALKRFVDAAMEVGIRAELIERTDYGRLAEFDALFIRATTYVNHYTYRFARRAAFEGLVVIDDPESIVKCTNKVFLAELLGRQEVPTPRTCVVHKDNVETLTDTLGLPLVLKKPDSSFSHGVIKVESEDELESAVAKFFGESDLLVAQEFLPTEFDWRIGILNEKPLYACKYFMAKRHWQIYKHEDGKGSDASGGKWETLPVELAPRRVVSTALKAANLIGNGLYGVDLKQAEKEVYVMEVNDNPSIESGVEDQILRDELYRRIMSTFLERIERLKSEGIRA